MPEETIAFYTWPCHLMEPYYFCAINLDVYSPELLLLQLQWGRYYLILIQEMNLYCDVDAVLPE